MAALRNSFALLRFNRGSPCDLKHWSGSIDWSLCVKGTIREEEAAKAAAITADSGAPIHAEERRAEILDQLLYAAKVVAEKEAECL